VRIAVLLFAATISLACCTCRAEDSQQQLFQAIEQYDATAVERLLARDSQLAAARDAKGHSAVLRALFTVRGETFVDPKQNTVLSALLRAKPALDIFEMCGTGDAAGVRSALGRDPKLASAWHSIGWSALHFAAFSGDVATAHALLDAGAPLDARARNHIQNTPLLAALLAGQADTAALLMERGADTLVRQEAGVAAIHEVALSGRRDLVDLLLAHGADINARADDGRTAVTEALRGSHEALADYLRAHGGHDATIVADLSKAPQ
jgi:ankyrin repeat protein